jgi:hypothetical protein
MADLQAAILVIDEHLEEPSGKAGKAIKDLFGLGELENDEYVPRLCLRRLGVVRSKNHKWSLILLYPQLRRRPLEPARRLAGSELGSRS